MSSAITVRALSFELPNGRALFDDLNFTLGEGVTALVGPNGVGKSCLAQLLAGALAPTRGQVCVERSVTYFPQRQPAPHVSVAMLLNRGGLLLISHDSACLACCDEVLELSRRGLASYGGGWQGYLQARDRERAQLLEALQTAKAEREQTKRARQASHERQEKRAARGAQRAAKGGMPRIAQGLRRGRAQATAGRLEANNGDRIDAAVQAAHAAYEALKIDPMMYADLLGDGLPTNKLVARAQGFNVRFAHWLYAEDIDFAWRGNVRTALKGPNCSGKSTLLRALTGHMAASSLGPAETRGSLDPGDAPTLFIDQRCAQLDDTLSVLQNVQGRTGLSEAAARNGLAKFLFARDAVFQQVANLSGGERLRAALAVGLLAPIKPQKLVLDEPTNNLDAGNVFFLQTVVRDFPGAVIVVSHDERFLDACGVTDAMVLHLPLKRFKASALTGVK